MTDKTGDGLYQELLEEIFKAHDIELNIQYMPFRRAIYWLTHGKIDITGGIEEHSVLDSQYLRSQYPIFVSPVNLIFRKSALRKWQGIDLISDRKFAKAPKVAASIDLSKNDVIEVSSRQSAFKMLLTGRVDFYIDNEKSIERLVADNATEFEQGDYQRDYQIETVAISKKYMVFPNTERGKKIKTLFEEGLLKLYQAQKLQPMYQSRGYLVPDYSK